MNVLLLLAHSIEEYDQLKLLTELGYTVASIGGYIDPRHPHDPKRPALDIDRVEAVWDAVQAVPATPERPDRLWNAKDDLPQAIIDWADVIICHHVEWRWLIPQWDRLREKRVIWRTVGQSSHENEARMKPLYQDGLQIVRYSPKERNLPNFAGEDALIRFWKDPDEWKGWTGEDPVVTNVTQSMIERANFCNLDFWQAATRGIPVKHAGRQSEMFGGVGELPFEDMKALLRTSRAYLYTGTQPASYTLGLIEALMTGIPVVSIGPGHMRALPYGPKLFEGHEFASYYTDDPAMANYELRRLINGQEGLGFLATERRERAIEAFGKATVGAAWLDFLGAP